MGLRDDLSSEVKEIFRAPWSTTKKIVVPDPADIGLGNDAGHFSSATILYADLDGSTAMVDSRNWYFSAEVYKTFLHCSAKIIKSEGGVITAYDGDRIMAVFVGDTKNTSAVRSGLQINYAVSQIINPALAAQYPNANFSVKHVVGIDTSEIHAARIGVRGNNDLVWVGRAPNYAAKLTSLPDYALWITDTVYDSMNNSVRVAQGGANIWEQRLWIAMNNLTVYRTNGWLSF